MGIRKSSRNRLRVLRAEHDITQMDLAIKAGLSPNRYWRIEKGYEDPKPAELSVLARILRVEVDALGFVEDTAVLP